MKKNCLDKFECIAVLYGGHSAEREVSLKSGSAIYTSLKRLHSNVILLDIQNINILYQELKQHAVDFCFIAVHGRDGEDGRLQGFLDLLHIPYTGTGVLGSALCMDKRLAKQVVSAHGVATPVVYSNGAQSLAYPVVVKPIHQGSSIGVHKVMGMDQLECAYLSAAQYGEVMIEAWIVGREYAVSIVGSEVLSIIEIQPTDEFYTYQAKYQSGTQYHCPCDLTEEEDVFLKEQAYKIFNLLSMKGWGRIDFIRSAEDRKFYFIEANTVPGFTALSLVPKAAEHCGIDYDDLVLKIVNASVEIQTKKVVY